MRTRQIWPLSCLLLSFCLGCDATGSGTSNLDLAVDQPSILLVTLDTTRADRVEPEAPAGTTPNLAALALRGRRFPRAYTTVPLTLPAHASMLTGLSPAEHGVHENSRPLSTEHPLLTESLRAAGYWTSAVVSGFPLRQQFGLARGFDAYDDDLGEGLSERRADETTDRALSIVTGWPESLQQPLFLWVHYYDAHHPYEPPEPFATEWADDLYQGEIAYVDQQLGRLVSSFERRFPLHRIVVVADHGEGLGSHGETRHGNLVYDEVMRVPLIVAGSGIEGEVVETPVGVGQLFGVLQSWGQGALDARLGLGETTVVLGEAMKPYLQYGWQPQVLAVGATAVAFQSGYGPAARIETVPWPEAAAEGTAIEGLPREVAVALRDYPLPASETTPSGDLSQEDRRILASLGYAGSPGERSRDLDLSQAPHPRDMTHLFGALDRGSELFVAGDYRGAIALYREILAEDERNFFVLLRLAVAHSVQGHRTEADEFFARASEIDADSVDLRHYLAQHLLASAQWAEAGALFESVLAQQPGRRESLRGLAEVRRREGDLDRAATLLERLVALEGEPDSTWLRLGSVQMERGRTALAIEALEEARRRSGADFSGSLDLGVCYLVEGRWAEAALELDRVAPTSPAYPLALFKRAQASALLQEPDWRERAQEAYRRADPRLREVIARERLFEGTTFP